MKAVKVMHDKRIFDDGTIVEMVVWKVPIPVVGSLHAFKYSLYFGRQGIRLVGFDNERGKGDHCHLDGQEFSYAFTSVEQLVNDFLRHVSERLEDGEGKDPSERDGKPQR